MCHIGMTFDIIFPYLKGFHLTLSKHLPSTNDEGWKLDDDAWNSYVQDKLDYGIISEAEAIAMFNKDIHVVNLFHCLTNVSKA